MLHVINETTDHDGDRDCYGKFSCFIHLKFLVSLSMPAAMMRGVFDFRHGIIPVASPGVAAAEAFHAKPASFEVSMLPDRFEEILRAGRFESASAPRSREHVQHGREKYLVKADEQSNHESAVRIEALWANCNHSR